MSIFTRPPSPPPRQPSPELHHTPLPSPHVRTRIRTMSNSPSTPPGLPAPRPHRPILTVRSFNDLPSGSSRTRPTPPATPRSLPSPTRDQFTADFHHRRTLSTAIPYRSPPPSPTIAAPPPPVPPIPSFVLSPPPTIKHCPPPAEIHPIHLPDLENLSPLEDAINSPRSRKQSLHHSTSKSKTRAVGMTCLRFFSIRNSKRRATAPSPSAA